MKLVRDRIPDLINSHGEIACISIADHDEYQFLLCRKLEEEVGEYLASRASEELADILEVVYALAACVGLDENQLESIRRIKANERGRFLRRIVWHGSREFATGSSVAVGPDHPRQQGPDSPLAMPLFDLSELAQPMHLGSKTAPSGRVTRARYAKSGNTGATGQQLELFLGRDPKSSSPSFDPAVVPHPAVMERLASRELV